MAIDISKLQTELVAGHPDTGTYNADNTLATAELNAVNRPAPASLSAIQRYFLLERKGSNGGVALFGRLVMVADSAVGTVDPLGDSVTMTLDHITAAKTMLEILRPGSGFSLDLNDIRFTAILDDLAASGAKVIAPADKTALIAFSNNQQSRTIELNLGVSVVKVGHVERARA